MENFTDYCRDTIIDALDSYEGQDVYPCDLAYTLTECMNANGTCTFSSAEAKDYIKEWWDEAALLMVQAGSATKEADNIAKAYSIMLRP